MGSNIPSVLKGDVNVRSLRAMRRFAHLFLITFGCVTACAAERAVHTVVITAKPKFEQRKQFVYLIISDTNHSCDISWAVPPSVQFVPVSLDTNRVYTFTVIEKESTLIPKHLLFTNIPIIPIHRVLRIEDRGKLVWDHEVCEIHKTKMVHKEVKIVYGLPLTRRDDPSADIERRLFPHHREYSLGGCVIEPDSPKTDKVYVCRDCTEAFEWWSGTATAPLSVLPRDTRYDHDPHLRLVYLEAFGKGYVAAWARKEALPVFGPTTDDDKARVLGYSDGAVAGRAARDAWSGANGQRYGPTNSASLRH